VTRTIRLTSAYLGRALAWCGQVLATVRAWFEPPLTADAAPLEVREAIVDRVTREVRATADGRRIMPHNRLTVLVLADRREDRAALGAVLDEIEQTIRGRLTELRCAVPPGFAVEVQYLRKPKPGWKAGARFMTEWASRTVSRATLQIASPPPGVRLKVLRGRASQISYSLADARILIGRTALPTDHHGRPRQNHVVFLEDGDEHSATVGRAHASIVYDGSRREYRLFDDGSHNGTRIVRGATTVDIAPRDPVGVTVLSGDEIQFGTAAVRVEIG
jgi:hypothetical protein